MLSKLYSFWIQITEHKNHNHQTMSSLLQIQVQVIKQVEKKQSQELKGLRALDRSIAVYVILYKQ